MEKNNVIADFQRGLNNKSIAEGHSHSWTTVIALRKAYKSFDKGAAEALFNHISLRAGIKSMIITTNLGFDRWNEIFTDKIIASAIVDRLTFKSYIINMNGPSFRIKATKEWIKERKMKQKTKKLTNFAANSKCSILRGKIHLTFYSIKMV